MAAVAGSAMVIPEPMQFSVVGAAGEVAPRQWYIDERDRFISWMRGEFAAANAIIDLLVQHIRVNAPPGEYDSVIGLLHQRRFHWSAIIHMQQFYPVSDIGSALLQVEWRLRQQMPQRHSYGAKGKDGRKPGFGHRFGNRSDGIRESRGSPVPGLAVIDQGNVEKKEDEAETHEDTKNCDLPASRTIDSSADAEKDAERKGSIAHLCHRYGNRSDGGKSRGSPVPGVAVIDQGNMEKREDEAETHNYTKNCDAPTSLTIDSSADTDKDGDRNNSAEVLVKMTPNQDENRNATALPKEFFAKELIDGTMVNVLEGLQLHENLLDSSEITSLVSLANETRAAGHRGELQGHTHVILKRPMKGHGREMIQYGVLVAERPMEDENTALTTGERNVEAIPISLQDVLDRLVQMQIFPFKPDFCIFDFFDEGDHSQPYSWPPWYGRPVFYLLLTECDFIYGRTIGSDHRGEYTGSLQLHLPAGSLLVMQGKSADLAKRAIPSLRKQRIVLTIGKSRPRKTLQSEGAFSPPSVRPANFSRHPPARNHYGVVAATGLLQAPPVCPQNMPPQAGVQPLIVAPPVVAPAAVPFPAVPTTMPPATAGWAVAATTPLHPAAPRLPVPGTGVFLPPGSVHSTPNTAEAIHAPQAVAMIPHPNGADASPESRTHLAESKIEGNGCLDNGNNVSPNEEQQTAAGKDAQRGVGGKKEYTAL